MKQIKKLFSGWHTTRILRMVLALSLGVSYYYNHETIFLAGAIMLAIQAIFNISCAGGSCGTNYNKTDRPIIKTEKYEPKK